MPAAYNETMPFRRVPVAILLALPDVRRAVFLLRAPPPHPRDGRNSTQTLLIADQDDPVDAIAKPVRRHPRLSAPPSTWCPPWAAPKRTTSPSTKTSAPTSCFRKPADIRLIGLFPVVRSKAFDMVSDGADFKLYIPSKNRFIVGRNDIDAASAQQARKPAPAAFPGRPGGSARRSQDRQGHSWRTSPTRTTPSTSFTRSTNADGTAAAPAHHLVQPDRPEHGPPVDLRRSRQHPHRRPLLASGIAYDNVPFPKHIEINRPRDEYGVVIDLVKMDINKGVSRSTSSCSNNPKEPRCRWSASRRPAGPLKERKK